MAVVTLPFGSVSFTGAPHAGATSVVDVDAVSGPLPSGSGLVVVVERSGPPVAGVYAVVVVRPRASVTDVERPYASKVDRVVTYTGVLPSYAFSVSVAVTRPRVGVAPNALPSNEVRTSEITSAGRWGGLVHE